MEVTIHRCSNKNYWYQKHIGSTFEVEDSHPDVTRYKVIGQDKTIDLEDTLEFNDYQNVLQRRDFEMTPSEEIYFTLPAVGSTSLSMAFPKVVFPQPLSPARPNTSPRNMSKSTPSTANT